MKYRARRFRVPVRMFTRRFAPLPPPEEVEVADGGGGEDEDEGGQLDFSDEDNSALIVIAL